MLTIGITGGWGTLHPALQHSAYGDCVLTNQFEPLVRIGRNGVIEPLAAKSWRISADRRVYRFLIDSSRRFSDGTSLRADDFKRSWEEGLRMTPISSNRAGLDVLASVRGFAVRGRTGAIAGLRVVSPVELEIEFREPTRMVLEHLAGVRYAAFKISRGRPIGTGTHVIIGRGRSLLLRPNPFYSGQEALLQMRMVQVDPVDVRRAMESGRVDAVLYASTDRLSGASSRAVVTLFGQEATHVMVGVNGLPGRLFSDPGLRRALQALIWRRLLEDGVPPALDVNHFDSDPQSLLRFQAGRLPRAEAKRLVGIGQDEVARLRDASRKNPIKVLSSRDVSWLIALLGDAGISTAPGSGEAPFEEMLRVIYKTHSADIIFGGFTVENGDPDGLYHILGRNGAIRSPMMARARVEDLMEQGRSLLTQRELDPHYRKVSEAILEEVPFVHLGYSYETIAYNPGRVRVSDSFANRNNTRVTVFLPR